MLQGISLEQAISIIRESVKPLGTESVPLHKGLGRTLACGVNAKIDQPPFDRSPLDGYALRSVDTLNASKQKPIQLHVTDTVYAGDVANVPVDEKCAVRIMTGAMLPKGCDCVIRQEDTDMGYPSVTITQALKSGENYCYRGEDYHSGTALINADTILTAAAIGILGSAGVSNISVNRRPSVCVLTTGDEVVSHMVSPLPMGKIYSANGPLLVARLQELGIIDVTCEHASDDEEIVAKALIRLAKEHDMVITTGGVSVGAKDVFHRALELSGATRHFWRVLIKPGTPLMYSTIDEVPILSLSGNPFAAAATFELLARPLLEVLSGETIFATCLHTAILDTPFPKASGGRRFIRGRYEDGRVTLPEGHSSGMLHSMLGCNCLLDIAAGTGALQLGDKVQILKL